MIHVIVAILSMALFSLSAVVALLQLLQHSRESRLEAGNEAGSSLLERVLERVPNAKRLEQVAFQTTAVGFVLWTFTLIFGAIWANYAWGRYWNWDPKETWTFVIWIVYAVYLHARDGGFPRKDRRVLLHRRFRVRDLQLHDRQHGHQRLAFVLGPVNVGA